MADEAEGQDTGAEASAGGVDSAAMALALGGASRSKADEFLTNQNALIADQRHHLHEQFKNLRLSIWEKRLGVLLRVATCFMGLAIAAGLAVMIWNASHSNGLIIEPFSVPPDLVARGLTGEVVAARILDGITMMQNSTGSTRAPRSYVNNWDARDIKLDIPETGVSLSELDHFLRDRLGQDIRLSGEIVRTANGLSLTARVGAVGADSVSGAEADLDALQQKLTELIYRLTQPYRYGVYLLSHGRSAEVRPVFEDLIKSGSMLDRAFGYNGLSDINIGFTNLDASIPYLQRALAAEPDLFRARIGLADDERYVGLEEASLRDFKRSLSLLAGATHGNARADFVPAYRKIAQAALDAELGAFLDAVRERGDIVETSIVGYGFGADQVIDAANEHDRAAAKAAWADFDGKASQSPIGALWGQNRVLALWARENLATQDEDWQGVLSDAKALASLAPGSGPRLQNRTVSGPLVSYAQARLGDFAAAEATLTVMPGNCYRCMIAHARVADLRGQRERADWWFARAADAAPSIPFAYNYWGQALLERGDADGAIAKFTVANQKGPHFADALEGLGEALIAKKQPDRALAKFAEAEKYAPSWGRLHLKWGEAVAFAGQKDEAQKQFALAAELGLSAADKAELARQMLGKV